MQFRRFFCALLALCLLAAAVPAFDLTARAASPYYVEVDLTNQIVTVYDNGNVSESGIVRQMICSSGKASTPTPKGTFTLPKKSRASERSEWYYFASSRCYAKWATRINGGILFHSILFNSKKGKPTSTSVNALGTKASHGCVRLKIEDAYWIAMNVPAGTKVKIFDGKKNSALHKLILKKTFSRDSQTYDSYLGRAPSDPNLLGRYSNSENVRALQNRLAALGFHDGATNGYFDAVTVASVKRFQAAIGAAATGSIYIGGDDWNRLFAGDAPLSTFATLSQGEQGPAVQALQQALKDCKMYDGPVDGNFDAATADAVRRYQAGFGFVANGAAATAMQDDALRRAADLRQQFGDAEYRLVETSNPILLARVKPRTLYMRKKKSTRAKTVKKLKKNKAVRVLRRGSWCLVQSGSKVGYVQKRYLKFYYGSETVLTYEAVPQETPDPTPFIPAQDSDVQVAALPMAPDPTPVPEAEPVAAPIEAPAAVPEAAPAVVPEAAPAAAEPVQAQRCAVALRDGVKLFAGPDAEVEPVAVMSAGAGLDVVAVEGDWVKVNCEGCVLYVAAADVELTDALPAASPEGELQPGSEPESAPQAEAQAADETAGTGLVIEEASELDQADGSGVEIGSTGETNE